MASGEEFLNARITAFDAGWPGLAARLASHSWRLVPLPQLIALLARSQSSRLQRIAMVCPSHDRAEQIQPSQIGDDPMATYLTTIRFTPAGLAAIQDSTKRAAAFKLAAKKRGVKVTATYWTMGD